MSDSVSEADHRLEGIQGWLIWPVLYVVTVAFSCIDTLLDSPLAASRPEVMAGNVALVAGAVVMLVLLFQKRTVVPALMVVFYVTVVAVCVVEVLNLTRFAEGLDPAWAAHALEEAKGGLGVALTTAIIWIPYFMVSQRVRNTFVE